MVMSDHAESVQAAGIDRSSKLVAQQSNQIHCIDRLSLYFSKAFINVFGTSAALRSL
jgi:hypothetical protein